MSEADALMALFALDQPPARDPAFVLETTRRIQQRRFLMELAEGIPWLVAVSAIFWAATPWLEAISRPASALATALLPAGAVAFGAFLMASPRSGPA